jgi:hypothetical protein
VELIIERNLPIVTPISHRKIGSIDPGICPIIDGNQMFTDTEATADAQAMT